MELLTRQFVHLPNRVLRGVVEEAHGNPLALLEFAASAGGRRDGRYVEVASGSSRRLRTLYQARIEQLPEPTRRLLLLAALDGSGDLGVLAAPSGPGSLVDLGPAERDHLIVIDDGLGAVRFRHPMIKSVVVERSTHDERRAAHQCLAELFADQPERRGHHLAEATDTPDEEIAAAIEEAAHRTLERGDVVGAISRLLRAADLSPNPADRNRRLAARPTPAPASPENSTTLQRCCAMRIARIQRSPRRSAQPSPRRISSSTVTATRTRQRTCCWLPWMTPWKHPIRIETVLPMGSTRWCSFATTQDVPSTGSRPTMR